MVLSTKNSFEHSFEIFSLNSWSVFNYYFSEFIKQLIGFTTTNICLWFIVSMIVIVLEKFCIFTDCFFISSLIVSLKNLHYSYSKGTFMKFFQMFNSAPSWTQPKLVLQRFVLCFALYLYDWLGVLDGSRRRWAGVLIFMV